MSIPTCGGVNVMETAILDLIAGSGDLAAVLAYLLWSQSRTREALARLDRRLVGIETKLGIDDD